MSKGTGQEALSFIDAKGVEKANSTDGTRTAKRKLLDEIEPAITDTMGPQPAQPFGLPGSLIEDGPVVYLSAEQASVCAQYPELANIELPCWVPQKLVARALGYSDTGITAAVASLGGRNYAWATELENVHTLWRYWEPQIVVDGVQHACSESFYHAQKPHPFSDAVWDQQKEEVMERAVRAKLAADPSLAELLRATGSHPLLSLKSDKVWGFDPVKGEGENLLAKIWMRVRSELVLPAGAQTLAMERKLEENDRS